MLSTTALLFILRLSCLARAVPSPLGGEREALPSTTTHDFDAVVVGGGPAGLAALSALGRVRRSALLIDSGEYRNGPTRRIHDVVGFDGVTAAYFRWSARQQLVHYRTVDAVNGTVTSIRPEANDTSFTVTAKTFQGSTSTYTARKIVIATGLWDLLPPTPGLQQNFGQGIYWCPWCDGHEHADQAMGILGRFDKTVEAVAEVATLNSDVVIFANGSDTYENRARAEAEFAENSSAYLDRRRVKVDNRTVTRITRLRDGRRADRNPALPTAPEYDLFRVEFETGAPVERGVLLTAFACEQRSSLARKLGLKTDKSKIVVDKDMRTSMPGVYAVGDANSDLRTNILHALHSGKSAAVHLHTELEREISRGLAPHQGASRPGGAAGSPETGGSWDSVDHVQVPGPDSQAILHSSETD
ncbi:Pyridine nucleotide-disulfide oxidoreductase, FAD/NAD(P)-binding domain protein [Metarhizium album ARSEF 1941]|uniref:Pyridine nucleotide-disulfide oxidoreductase, FAD/NAD(P)-binding domain protein n=1 Tax=Metarhizium album (strain ARSEF 1941) TaxID=1081103 RepID=A0A0B2WFN9_METAS|nr:Pyridine nucleotide-disulfide oxidoreductase, FAD/NAD(P)-binding domain protein [Metarhizium album ARSEF 1941]KHN94736.1 Pyridine nucleotide-disulfide oxidoreductase, FAD/NAD(P)-binding domain protein [Metarhizium album ARSEF 1941]